MFDKLLLDKDPFHKQHDTRQSHFQADLIQGGDANLLYDAQIHAENELLDLKIQLGKTIRDLTHMNQDLINKPALTTTSNGSISSSSGDTYEIEHSMVMLLRQQKELTHAILAHSGHPSVAATLPPVAAAAVDGGNDHTLAVFDNSHMYPWPMACDSVSSLTSVSVESMRIEEEEKV